MCSGEAFASPSLPLGLDSGKHYLSENLQRTIHSRSQRGAWMCMLAPPCVIWPCFLNCAHLVNIYRHGLCFSQPWSHPAMSLHNSEPALSHPSWKSLSSILAMYIPLKPFEIDLIKLVTTVHSHGDRQAVNMQKEESQLKPSQNTELLMPWEWACHHAF